MEVMQFALGLSTGLIVGYYLRDYVARLEIYGRAYGQTHGSKTKKRH